MSAELRLFVSSTFRDLQPERDALARQCFPQARQRFAQAGKALVEIDLRWGLPVGDSEERIVQLCLQEVERCLGHFVGILGTRYGHIPRDRPPPPKQAQPHWPEGASITEYEIRAGAFIEPPPRFVRFYFKQASAAEPDEPALARLKQEIRDRGFMVRPFASPEELAALLLGDLGTLADDTEAQAPDAATHLKRQLDVMVDGTVERPDVSQALDAFLSDPDSNALCVVGPAGVGKSTALAEWFSRARQKPALPAGDSWLSRLASFGRTRTLPEGDLWLAHFAGNQAGEGRFGQLLRSTLQQMQPAADAAAQQGGSLVRQLDDWQQALVGARQAHRRVVLLIDDVDDLGLDPAMPFHWLPPATPRIKLIICGRTPGIADRLSGPGWRKLTINPLPAVQRGPALAAMLARFGKALPPAAAEQLAAHPALATPAALRLLADELRLARAPEHLHDRVKALRALGSSDALADEVLQRLEQEHGHDLVAWVCGLLQLSRGGLYEGELRSMVQARQAVAAWRWSSLMQGFRRSVFDSDGRLGAFDPSLHAAIARRYLVDDAARAEALAALLAPYRQDSRHPQAPQRRTVEELPWQLWRAGRWDELGATLGLAQLAAAVWRTEPDQCRLYFRALQAAAGRALLPTLADAWRRDAAAQAADLTALALALAELGCLQEALLTAQNASGRPDAGRTAQARGADSLALATLLLEAGQPQEADAQLQVAEAACGPAGPAALRAAIGNARGLWQLATGQAENAAASFGHSLALLEPLGQPVAALQGRHSLSLARLQAGQVGAARTELKAVVREFERLHHLPGLMAAQLNLALVEERAGQLKMALRTLAPAEQLARQIQDLALLGKILAAKARVIELTGHRDGAEAAQLERQQLMAQAGLFDEQIDAMLARVAIRLNLGARGEGAAARLHLEASALVERPPPSVQRPWLRPQTLERLNEQADRLRIPRPAASKPLAASPAGRG